MDVVSALDAEPQAKAFFESLATFYRNTYIKWIEAPNDPKRVPRESVRWLNCSRLVRNKNDMESATQQVLSLSVEH